MGTQDRWKYYLSSNKIGYDETQYDVRFERVRSGLVSITASENTCLLFSADLLSCS